MFRRKFSYGAMIGIIICVCGLFSATAHAAPFKVLVVMSYEEDMDWVKDQKEGMDSVLKESCEIRYFYMDTKVNVDGGPEKAKEAYELYMEFQPDGIIVADDNGQSMFVVPYLKDKVKTPVMFCGVNADPDKYGYPAKNVSGILERHHNKEAIALARQLVPGIKTFGYMIKKSPVGDILTEQIEKDHKNYEAKFMGYKWPRTKKEALTMARELAGECDILLMSTLTGIKNDDGTPMSDKEIIPLVAKTFGKTIIGTELQVVEAGGLCSVLRTGQEQGKTAAEMLLDAMKGKPVSEIPIVRNYYGKRVINVTVLRRLGIQAPDTAVLEGAELVRTEK